jgi:hypothetical protein
MAKIDQAFEAQARSLREFGYRDVTEAHVRAAYDKWQKREPMADIVEMFCQSAFEDHPDLFGKAN